MDFLVALLNSLTASHICVLLFVLRAFGRMEVISLEQKVQMIYRSKSKFYLALCEWIPFSNE